VEVPLFTLRRSIGAPVIAGPVPEAPLSDMTLLAVVGIAGPERFLSDLGAAGWKIAGTLIFRDHHPYARPDLERIWGAARAHGAAALITTEKDFVRLLPFRPFALPVAYLPLTMDPEPADEFRRWLDAALHAARDIT
jgi:tetraacyldisaccharide 4'-kinase